MAQSLRLAGRVNLAGGSRGDAGHARNLGYGAGSSGWEWGFGRLPSANLLFVGTEMTVSNLVCSLWPNFDEPIVVRRRDDRLRLAPSSERVGTMILYGVDTLTDHEQHALQAWLSVRNGRTRVVSTVSESLLPMIEAGAFSDSLYYRLNVVCIDLRTQR
jgi:hypothetical protein